MGWFLIILVLLPVVFWLVDNGRKRKCPACREQMDRKATVCPHCRTPVTGP